MQALITHNHSENETCIEFWGGADRRLTLYVSDRIEFVQAGGNEQTARSGLATRRVLRRLKEWVK